MTNPDSIIPYAPVVYAPRLRDRMLDHLPMAIKALQETVVVTYCPRGHGDSLLSLRYNPFDEIIDMEIVEEVVGPEGEPYRQLVKGCEIHSDTAEVIGSVQYLKADGPDVPLRGELKFHNDDAIRFDKRSEEYFRSLFDGLYSGLDKKA